jgi:hypothetical protein
MAKAEPLDTTDAEPAAKVFRRRVFYIPGFDPFPPRRYRELYRKEGAAQAAILGYDLQLRPKGKAGWTVTTTIELQKTEAHVEVLVWSDIVQSSMSGGIPATYAQLLRTAWAYIGSGALFRLMRLRKGPVIAALYPVAALVLQAILALVMAAATVRLVGWAMPGLDGRGYIVHAALAFGVSWAVLEGFRRADRRLKAWYLMHDYAFVAQHGGADPAALTARLDQFAARIRATLEEPWDEVLLVGHSSGAHMGVQVLAQLIRQGLPAPTPAPAPALSLLTLGQVVPMVSFLPHAHRLRSDLQFLSTREDIVWVDVTAPSDGCAFALCDPVAVTGVATEGQRWPLVISAAFTQTLSAARWKALRWRFFRLHFQYLCAFDRPGDYDYFQITAGAQTLADRYRDRAPSKSRIVTPVNRFTSTR